MKTKTMGVPALALTLALLVLLALFALPLASCNNGKGEEDDSGGGSGESALASGTASEASGAISGASENSGAAAASREDSAEQSAEQSAGESGDRQPHPDEIADFSPYITLGEYKGLKLRKTTVTDELLRQKREALLDSEKELRDVGTERAAAAGDTAVFDYKGFRSDTGEAFEGGEATDAELVLGSGRFIPGFEEGIIGHKAGENFDIKLSFPEDYGEQSLAGQPVRFEIKLRTVKETVYPELTDELAKKLKYDSAAALLAEARRRAEEQVYAENLSAVWQAAVKNVDVKSFPQELFDYTAGDYADYYFSSCVRDAARRGMELEDYAGMPADELRRELQKRGEEYAKSYLTDVMTMYAIADAEFGREISEDEYGEKAEEYAKKEGVTVDELSEKYDRRVLIFNMLWDKVTALVYEAAVFTE